MRRCWIALLICLPLAAQVAERANENYKTPQGREALARGLDNPGREERQKPAQLVAAVELKPGMTVADLGTGVGYMLPFLSRAVGAQGRVIAEDIEDDFLVKAKAKAAKDGLANVTFVKGTERDPNLPAGACDVVFVLDSYHHFDYPADMLDNIAKGLAPGGRLILVDYYKSKDSMPGGGAIQHIRLDEADVIKEVESNGYKLISSRPFLPKVQYMAIFGRK